MSSLFEILPGLFIIFVMMSMFGMLGSKDKPAAKGKRNARRSNAARSGLRSQAIRELRTRAAKELNERGMTSPSRLKSELRQEQERRARQGRGSLQSRNKAIERVGNKTVENWGSRGDHGLTSSKGVILALIILWLAYYIIANFFPQILGR